MSELHGMWDAGCEKGGWNWFHAFYADGMEWDELTRLWYGMI